ncbi:hypothetical protein ANN_21290 [Periplaneta americana]|uniref:Metalloendopeptidase n=1 Tax=Periplaneta americana TaxID=6978 RepID=A0ABQ8SG78_PERAM|nr:hypothetical protein ANN_21290 [Periplaneta americana]
MVCLLISEVELKLRMQVPPKPRHHALKRPYSPILKKQVERRVAEWSPQNKVNLWEISGQHEGDMLFHNFGRNGVIKKSERWPKGIIPYYITDDFSEEEKHIILDAMDTFNRKTCVKFRPYKKGDKDFITIVSQDAGCYSFVGHLDRGQVVNFQKQCLRHGTIMHELLHVLGFFHQHSASERDDFITINWNNIKKGNENQFGKNNTTNFGEPYDYESVMHYSTLAFSKNKEPTIIPLRDGVEIGQRRGASVIDLNKVRKMYRCKKLKNNRLWRKKIHKRRG